MSSLRLYNVLQKNIITEKSSRTSGGEASQYVFRVIKDTNKQEIKKSVEQLFKVKVQAVRVLNMKPKVKRFKQRLGKQSGWKKAYVTLMPGQRIELSEATA
jgi:large subunit ribosomal protein L23